ncbi:uncharacterized protein LOC119066388 [Bradysia coprophila]|uniref:uncharacterized protein LOC119066388 n=1 Tax=Bradysia coprophila TaxID=38358 RepID=UPI00187D7134|nr:uncharacterized protein LOC119066388 [Bradysia coprophila]
MSVENTWTPLLYTFYFLGQSPFPSTSIASKSYFKRLLLKLPILIVFCASMYGTIHFFNTDFYFAWHNEGLIVIHILLILSSIMTNLVMTSRSLFRGSVCVQLQQSFNALEMEFKNLLPNKNVQLGKFRNVFLMKFFTVLISYIVLVFAMTMSRIKTEYSHTSFMIVLAFINDLCALQVVLYVDLTKFFLKTITGTFRKIAGEEAKCVREAVIRTELLVSTKKCYLSISKTVDKINEHFGPFLLAYIVQQFLAVSYYIFWVLDSKFSIGLWPSIDNGSVLLCALLSLYLVLNSCHKICTETQSIGSFLYEDDYLVRGDGQRFLTLIINQPIKITTMDFFKLDRSFFASITIGGITSAIMLVQFRDN